MIRNTLLASSLLVLAACTGAQTGVPSTATGPMCHMECCEHMKEGEPCPCCEKMASTSADAHGSPCCEEMSDCPCCAKTNKGAGTESGHEHHGM